MNLFYKEISINDSLTIIKNNSYCHMGMSKNNKPYIVPMNYQLLYIENQYFLKLLTLKKCKKMDIICENGFINFNFQEVIDNSVISVMAYGHVEKIEEYNSRINVVIVKLDYITGRIISNTNK